MAPGGHRQPLAGRRPATRRIGYDIDKGAAPVDPELPAVHGFVRSVSCLAVKAHDHRRARPTIDRLGRGQAPRHLAKPVQLRPSRIAIWSKKHMERTKRLHGNTRMVSYRSCIIRSAMDRSLETSSAGAVQSIWPCAIRDRSPEMRNSSLACSWSIYPSPARRLTSAFGFSGRGPAVSIFSRAAASRIDQANRSAARGSVADMFRADCMAADAVALGTGLRTGSIVEK